MQLKTLAQLNFRNLRTQRLEFQGGIVAIRGANASGKSNLLAAAYLGCTATPAAGNLGELVRIGETEAYVAAEVEHDGGLGKVEVGLGAGHKSVKLDSQTVRALDVAKVMSAVLLTPDDSELIHGPPAARRTFLDALLSKLSFRYGTMLREYQRVVEQRNALLRAAPQDPSLPIWSERFVSLGTALDELRERAVTRLGDLAAEVYSEVAGSAERLSACLERRRGELDLAEALERSRGEELARGVTVVGPHRDDLRLTLAGKALRSYGSRGEARTAAMALRVAEYRMLEGKHGEPPVLLIDDFSAELDGSRRGYLLNLTATTPQALVSGTDAPPRFDQLFEVSDGVVSHA